MNAERQRHARAIAEAALRVEPGRRTRLVEEACGTDEELSSQVESILTHLDEPSTRQDQEADTTTVIGPRTWGTLTLLEEIGHGGFGRVFRAWDSTLAREVALKLIPTGRRDSAVAATVLREGRLLARLQHPNIVTVFGAQQIGEEVGLWMEFVRGTTLADMVRKQGPLGPTEAAVIGTKLCSALSAVHQAGLVHRDVKARNVMRAERGRIVLMDFGAGREVHVPAARAHTDIIGTPSYMAYEVLSGQAATPASDIYSLGVLLFFLVTGTHPVRGATMGEVRAAFDRDECRLLGDLRADLPDAFVTAVERALAREPEARFASAAAFRQELVRVAALDDESGDAITPPARQSGAHSGRAPTALETGATLTSSPGRLLGTTAWALLLIVLAVGAMGFLSSMAFDVAYGRVGTFAQESPAVWFRVGAQGLVAPAVAALLGSLLLIAATTVCRTAIRISTRCRHASDWLWSVVRSIAIRIGLDDPLAIAAAICVAGLGAIGAVWWRFSALFSLVRTPLSGAPASLLTLLAPPDADEFGERALYRFVLEFMLFALIVAWVWLLRYHRSRPETAVAARLAPLPVVALTLFMLVVPYRVLYPGEFERVMLDGAPCYVIGQQSDSLLLFCPHEAPPRTRAVVRDRQGLIRTGVWQHPFERDIRTPVR